MEQVSFLLKCCADRGLPNLHKILLGVVKRMPTRLVLIKLES